jgi:hypothetical protein
MTGPFYFPRPPRPPGKPRPAPTLRTLTRWLTPWRTIRRLEAENQRLREQAVLRAAINHELSILAESRRLKIEALAGTDGSDTYQQCEYCDGTGKVDDYGNPSSGDRVIYCTFPDCGCDGARLCQAEKGASERSCMLNIERGSLKP